MHGLDITHRDFRARDEGYNNDTDPAEVDAIGFDAEDCQAAGQVRCPVLPMRMGDANQAIAV